VPITPKSFKHTPYLMPSFEYTLLNAVTDRIGDHIVYDPARIRGTATVGDHQKGMKTITGFAPGAAGDTIYLPWKEDHITSTILPNPAPAGVRQFITAGMSGCKFFVDTITGSSNLLVYHANAKKFPAPAGSLVNFQPPAAITFLDQLHTTAQAYYAAAPRNLTAVDAAEIAKLRYYRAPEAEVLRKQQQGRLNLSVDTGVALMAFWEAPRWVFYWQVFGDTEYDRPAGASPHFASLRGKSGTHKSAAKMRVLEYQNFYTSP
jgi:hypothetical protein